MRVLIVGGGGREHALAWAISRSPLLEALFCAPGNAGTALLLRDGLGENLPVHAEDMAGIVEATTTQQIDLVIVGPEAPLATGLVDTLASRGIAAFGPTRAAAELESSKWFAKGTMKVAGVPHAIGESFTEPHAAHSYIDDTFTGSAPPVVKADGLAAGKGVIVSSTLGEAHIAVDALLGGLFGAASNRIVVEELLSGLEASAMALVDGVTVRPLPFACDYKRVGDNDTGSNTGGMGAYSPTGFLGPEASEAVTRSVYAPTTAALMMRNRPYRGLLYAGLMVHDSESCMAGEMPWDVLEFNCRFGDPETQVIVPRLCSDLLEALSACSSGRLEDVELEWSDEATVGVVLASGGYPGPYETGKAITGLETVDKEALVFHAGTRLDEAGGVVTDGGRVLTVVGRGETLAAAREVAYANAARIQFEGQHYRTDIALREIEA